MLLSDRCDTSFFEFFAEPSAGFEQLALAVADRGLAAGESAARARRAARLQWMARFAELACSTLQIEMQLHRDYAAQWGISDAQLEQEQPQAATRAYTDFLLRTAALGDFHGLIAALLPCMWGYSELGRRLADSPGPAEERYARWIEMYSGPQFAQLAGWCREVCDQAVDGVGEAGRTRLRAAFLASSRHELAFVEQAWRHRPCDGVAPRVGGATAVIRPRGDLHLTLASVGSAASVARAVRTGRTARRPRRRARAARTAT